ncbi:MAG: tetratricopeptide repeat protein [Bacteroidetes bacterium]|nr:tetratricopeptide repeat protein [Bacteroidota bacterium]
MNKIGYILLIVFLIVFNCLKAQTFGNKTFYLLDSLEVGELSDRDRLLIDSLLNIYHKSNLDTIKLKAISSIVEECWDDNVWPKYNGILVAKTEKLLQSSKKFTKSEDFFLHKLYTSSLSNQAYFYDLQGKSDKAIKVYEQCLKLFKEIGDEDGLATTYNNIGYVYRYQGNIAKAIEYYQLSLNLNEKIKNKKGIALALNNLGLIYVQNNEIDQAERFLKESLKLKLEVNDKQGIGYAYINLADIYRIREQKELALDYYDKAIETLQQIGERHGIANCYNNIGLIYWQYSDYELSEKFFKKGLDLNVELKNFSSMAVSYVNMGNISLKKKNFSQAEIFGKKSLKIAQDGGYTDPIRDASSLLYELYKLKGNYAMALKMHELFVQMKDSITNENTKKESIRSQLKYSYEKQAVADSIKNAEEKKVIQAKIDLQNAQLKQEHTFRITLYSGLVLVIIFAGFMYNRFKVTQRQNIVIEEQKHLVENQKQIIEEKHKEVLDSIRYAKRIQDALLTPKTYIERNIKRLKEL